MVDKKHRLSIERSRSLMKLVIIGITVDTYFSLIRANLTFGQVNIGRSFLCLTVSCGIYSRIGIRILRLKDNQIFSLFRIILVVAFILPCSLTRYIQDSVHEPTLIHYKPDIEVLFRQTDIHLQVIAHYRKYI